MKTVEVEGIPLSKICLGCANFGTKEDKALSFEIMDFYFEQGGRFFNTAHEYGNGLSETCLGDWVRARGVRDQVILTSKGGEDRTAANWYAMHREDLLQDIDESLQRMGVEYLDFYMLHVDDTSVSIEEILSTMDEIRKSGKIRHYGCSNWSVERQREASAYAKAHGIEDFVLDEIEFTLARNNPNNVGLTRWLSPEFVAYHEETGKAVGGYSPLAAGFLTKLVRDGDLRNVPPWYIEWYRNPYTMEVGRRLKEVSEQTGWSATQIQLSWLLTNPYTFPNFLILGASSTAQLADSLKAFEITLSPEIKQYLRPDPVEFPPVDPQARYPAPAAERGK